MSWERIDLRAQAEYLMALAAAEQDAFYHGTGYVKVTYTKGNFKRLRFKRVPPDEAARVSGSGNPQT